MLGRLSADGPPRWAPPLLLACAGMVVLAELSGQSLAFDEWTFFADYRGWSPEVLASPFGDNLLALPAAIYKLIFAAFGPETIALDLALVALNLTCAGLFFVLLGRRTDRWIALAASVLLVLFGASSDLVAATLGLAILFTTACGLGALLALERGDRTGDLIAAALLAAALASNSHGLPFAAGVAVQIGFVDRRPWRPRAWVAAVPLALYAGWRAWEAIADPAPAGPAGAHPRGELLDGLAALPSSVADSLGAALVSITGLFIAPTQPGPFDDVLGPVLATLAVLAVAARLRSAPAPPREAAMFAAMALVFWAMIAIAGNDRVPTVPRYQYDGAIFVLLTAAALTSHLRAGPVARAVAIGAAALSLGTNFAALHEDADFFRERGEHNRAALAAVEIARDTVDPELMVEPLGARLDPASPLLYSGAVRDLQADALISAGSYLEAARDLGSAAFTEADLRSAGPAARDYADRALAIALEIRPAPFAGRLPGGCARGTGAPGDPAIVDLRPAGELVVKAGAGAGAVVGLSRFGEGFAARLEPLPAGAAARIALPEDRSAVPWRARVLSEGGVVACAP